MATQAPPRGGRVAQRQQGGSAVQRVDPDKARQALDQAFVARQQALAESAASMIDPAKMRMVVLSTFTRTPSLWECDPVTIVRAVIEAAQAGLEPTGALGGAYLVPFFNGKTGRKEAQLIIGYTGLVKLARRSGEIAKVEARVVRQMDEFDYAYGLNPFVHHKPALDVPQDAQNPMTHAYGVIHYRSGETQFDVMTAAEILAIKARSKSKDKQGNPSGPWVTDEPEMWKKTVLRRTMKLAPLTIEVQRVLDAEDDIELERSSRARQVGPARAVAPSRIAARVMGGDHGEAASTQAVASPPPDEPVPPPAPGEVEPSAVGAAAPSPDEPIDAEYVDEEAGEITTSQCEATSPYVADGETGARCTRDAGHSGNHRSADKESW